MKTDTIVKLPLMETVVRSFMSVIKNISTFAKICSIFVLLWIAEIMAGLPALCSANESYCRFDTASHILMLLMYLSSAVVSVNTIRGIILKQDFKWFHLPVGKYTVSYIGYTLLIAAMIIIPSALILMISGAGEYAGISKQTAAFLNAAFIATFIGLSIFCFRLYLVFAASAIGDKEMTLAKSYALTRGNMLKIFFGQMILVIPTILIVVATLSIYRITEWSIVGNSIFVLIGMCCSYFDAAVKASYHSHLYQFFIYRGKNDK